MYYSWYLKLMGLVSIVELKCFPQKKSQSVRFPETIHSLVGQEYNHFSAGCDQGGNKSSLSHLVKNLV